MLVDHEVTIGGGYGENEKEAVEAVEESSMTRHDVARVFQPYRPFEHGLDQVAQCTYDTTYKPQNQPIVPHKASLKQRADKQTCGHCCSHTMIIHITSTFIE